MPADRIGVPTERIDLLRAALDHLQQGRFAATEANCNALLARGPDCEAELLLGLALGAQGQTPQAMRLFDRVARARPGHAHPCRDLAELLAGLGRTDEAVSHYQTWLARAPDDAAAHHAIGLLLAELGRIPEALLHFQRVVAIDPDPAMGWSNLGMMLKIERQFDASIAAHDQAVARAPEDPQVRVNRAVALLHAGRLTEAWCDYEWRLRQPGHASLPMTKLLPDIHGCNLAGRTVLVTHEEGFGDTLQFLRYVPMLAARGARVVLAVPNELARIAATLDGVSEILPPSPLPLAGEVGERSSPGEGSAPGTDFDFRCPVFSLPRAFGTTLQTIPAPIPYLRADPILVEAWSHRLPAGPRIGLVWAGQARPWLSGFTTLDRRRSAGLAHFAPLGAVPGVRFISLQKGPPALEARTAPPGMTLHDPMSDAADFADTAAIISNLDLVVSVDTAVVHLAGALGKPVFLLDRYDNCWRWFSGRQDSPWYPLLRIFRQDSIGDWVPPMHRVAEALRNAFPIRAEASTSERERARWRK